MFVVFQDNVDSGEESSQHKLQEPNFSHVTMKKPEVDAAVDVLELHTFLPGADVW